MLIEPKVPSDTAGLAAIFGAFASSAVAMAQAAAEFPAFVELLDVNSAAARAAFSVDSIAQE